MKPEIIITVNNKKIQAKQGQTILEAAEENGIKIPTLCSHSDLTIKASCRVCVVKIEQNNRKFYEPACSTKAVEGMKILTDSPIARALRKTNLELLFSQHKEECSDCVWQYNCQLLKLAKEYKVEITRFPDRKTNYPTYQFGPALIFDSSKCIDCGNCIEMCNQQAVRYLELKEKDTFHQILPSQTRKCIYCGQCLLHCPAGAFEAVGEFEEIERPLRQKDKKVIFQIAPSIRTTIGEEFGIPLGEPITEKVAAGIKKLGADKVFDTSVGADFTTAEEAKELIKKMNGGKCFTLFSSCCPSWVRFVEVYYPEFVPQIAAARPPHIILGGLIKTFFAQKEKTDPENIYVVSVMPCCAKKYEITRKEFLIETKNGRKIPPVDCVLTTRELTRLFLKHKIDLKTIKPQKLDEPLGIPSGGGIIYGASGGVMESALRVAAKEISGGQIDFKQVRGQQGIKIAEVKIGNKKLKMAAVSGTGNAKKILDELKQNPAAYDCCEVMACWGGCIGGGGQPMPTDGKIRQARADGLYQIDKAKKLRIATENPIVKKVYKEFLTNEDIIEKVCRAKYVK